LRGLIDPLKATFAWLAPAKASRCTRQDLRNQARAEVPPSNPPSLGQRSAAAQRRRPASTPL